MTSQGRVVKSLYHKLSIMMWSSSSNSKHVKVEIAAYIQNLNYVNFYYKRREIIQFKYLLQESDDKHLTL